MNPDQIIEGYLNNHIVVVTLEAEQKLLLRRIFTSIPTSDAQAFVMMSGQLMSFCSNTLTNKQQFEYQAAQIANKALEIILDHKAHKA